MWTAVSLWAARFLRWTSFKANLLLFFVLSFVISVITEHLPVRFYDYRRRLFRERKWERGGRFYEQFFLVKRWKTKLPELSDYLKVIFSKRRLKSVGSNYLLTFVEESCKAEFTHWIIILSSLLFFFRTDSATALRVFFVASVLNLPYIIIQRYNRPRILHMLRRKEKTEVRVEEKQPMYT